MLLEFSSAAKENSSVLHSKLMPLLTLVTNLCVGLQTFVCENVRSTVLQFRTLFEHFFSSDIYNVRKLSAKAHSLFLTSTEIVPHICRRCEEIMEENKSDSKSENKVHGYLLNIVQLYSRFKEERVGMKALKVQEEKIKTKIDLLCQNVLNSKLSYFVKSLVFQLDYVEHAVVARNSIRPDLGLSYLNNQLVFNLVYNSCENEINEKVNLCLIQHSSLDLNIACLVALKQKMSCKQFCTTGKNTLNELLKTLNTFSAVCFTDFPVLGLTLQNMLIILEIIAFKESTFFENTDQFISKGLETLASSKKATLALVSLLPVVCGVVVTSKIMDVSLMEKLAEEIQRRSDSSFIQDVRVHAAKALVFLTRGLHFPDIKETRIAELVWESAVTFLQDEANDVRFEASKFVTHLFPNADGSPLNPVVSLDILFELSSINCLMNTETAVKCLWKQLLCSSVRDESQEEIVNPFNHNTVSIYTEDHVMSHRAFLCLCELVKSVDPSEKNEIECIVKQNYNQVLIAKLNIANKTAQYIEKLKQLCNYK